MMLATYTAPNGTIIQGILLKRERTMMQIAWDETPAHHFSIGWCPIEQIGKITLKVAAQAQFRHPAFKRILAGDVEGAWTMYRSEEAARMAERLKKERAA